MAKCSRQNSDSKPYPLCGTSLCEILSTSLESRDALTYDPNEDIENVPMLYDFLGFIWTSLTDSSLYEEMSDSTNIMPFRHSQSVKEKIVDRIIVHFANLSSGVFTHLRDDLGDASLRNIVQGHLLTCMKITTYFLMSNKSFEAVTSNITAAILDVIEIFMMLVPACLELSTLLDFFTDFVKSLPHKSIVFFIEFVFAKSSFFRENFLALENNSSPKIVQTSGAKMIAMIKAFESNLKSACCDDAALLTFNLRVMLTSCLPISHLGVCNRQSLSKDWESISRIPNEEWTRLESILKKESYVGITDREIQIYEAVAAGSSHRISPIFDMQQIANKIKETKSTEGELVRSTSFKMYAHYCDVVNFVFSPESIIDMSVEAISNLSKGFKAICSHVTGLLERNNGEIGMHANVTIIAPTADCCDFLCNYSNLSFWIGIILSSIIAVEGLSTSHRRGAPEDTVISKLKEKPVQELNSIKDSLWRVAKSNSWLMSRTCALLEREKHWVSSSRLL
ncbi:hypothetical protein BdWA1_002392 [Babesia duncani]|uniref:Uncharacterized protein n=1 Tax=Babesia duncani TaxID=323732 RepID=A0AAD9PJ50_9APIC|nr:hypothetical protein BdWA1_002392 [Babesia duncani]